MINKNEYDLTLSAANGLIERLKNEVKALRELSELQDKMLVCYRVGKNPGTIIDKLIKAREEVAKF